MPKKELGFFNPTIAGDWQLEIAIVQLEVSDTCSRTDRFQRVRQILNGIYQNSEQYPALIMLPEIWGVGFFNFPDYAVGSEAAEGETYSLLAPWAEKLNCYILGGSIVESEGGSLFNSALLINPRGELIGKYRKIHLFGYESEERKILSPGTTPAVISTELGTLGITTCYDLRFPELYRRMVEQGAEIFLVVSAWPLARLDHWILLNRARALENQCYLVSCNCSGSIKGVPLGGNSMIVDPSGTVIMAGREEAALLRGSISLHKVAEYRASFPALKDRILF